MMHCNRCGMLISSGERTYTLLLGMLKKVTIKKVDEKNDQKDIIRTISGDNEIFVYNGTTLERPSSHR